MHNYSFHQILTVASMAELEASTDSDRSMVSRVFYNRLEQNMTLGSDVTTYYGAKINIGEYKELALAPLAVLPEYQKQGIGKKLIEEGHKIAKKLGYHFSVVLGSENYYPKMGYVPAIQFEIKSPFDVPNENFMAIKLNDFDKEIIGTVEYAKEFGI